MEASSSFPSWPPSPTRGKGMYPTYEGGYVGKGRILFNRVGQIPAKETVQDKAWKKTKSRDNTVNTSPAAEREAGKLGLNSLDIPLQNCFRTENPTPFL